MQIPERLIDLILKYGKDFYRSHSEAVIDGTRKIAKELVKLKYQMMQLSKEEDDENVSEKLNIDEIEDILNGKL